jgi:putative ABC transport system ATP-binding protein
MNEEAFIELRDVSVPSRRNSDTAVIENVNWTVRRGEFWVFGGPQGAGKSDLVFMLGGLTKPITGCYQLFGTDMGQRFGDEFLPNRVRVGMVFDDARLLSHLTLAENVALPARYHHNLLAEEVESWVAVLMKETSVLEFAANTPSAVPRHWRLRAALARALALKPELLLLENPLRGQDARHAAWWLGFLQKLWRGHDLLGGRPMTIVASTDEFWPWRQSGAKFASFEGRRFVINETMPQEHEADLMKPLAGGV